jgi:hypothetical protein
MTAASASLSTGNIQLTSTGATTQNISVSGTVNALPTITLSAVPNVTTLSTSFSIPYTAITNAPTLYSVSTGATALANFSAITDALFSGATGNLAVTIPSNSTPGTYNFNVTVKNANGCSGTVYPVILTLVSPPPSITSFSPLSGAAGTSVTITGTGFNTTSANNIVRLNGMKCTVTNATATTLTIYQQEQVMENFWLLILGQI